METEGGSREGENESASMLEIGQKNIYKGEHNDIFQRCFYSTPSTEGVES